MARNLRLKRKYDPQDYKAQRYRVKLFRPMGYYPRGTFCTPTGLLHADAEIVFAVTFGVPWNATEGLPYSEVDWLQPELVRLLGSLILTEQFPEGHRCSFYPMTHGDFVIDEASLDLTSPDTAAAVRKALLNTVNNRLWNEWIQRNWKLCIGTEFDLFDPHDLSIDLYQTYWTKMSTDNHVLMRGLQALMKSDMLMRHSEFTEEATIAAFIAMDASFQLVLRHLRANGMANPSAHDAGDWLYTTFDKELGLWVDDPPGLKYFEEFYEQRIQTIHPGSRLGDMPYSPVMADDQMHLRATLPPIFAYLVHGKHPPFFWQKVEERRARSVAPQARR